MHHVIFESPLNVSFLMIDAMREALNRSKTFLPYGMALTIIFRQFDVSFEGETVCRLLNTDTYNNHSLRHMGFISLDGRWTKGRGDILVEEEEHAEEEGPLSPPELRSSSDIHFMSEPEVDLLVNASPSTSRVVPSSSRLGEEEMGLLAERVAGILSIQ